MASNPPLFSMPGDDVRGCVRRAAPVPAEPVQGGGAAPGHLLPPQERLQRPRGGVRQGLPHHQHHHRAGLVLRAQGQDGVLSGTVMQGSQKIIKKNSFS